MSSSIFGKIENLFHKRLRTPTVLQMEATECGAASLTMILAYYGLWMPLEKVREECGVGRDGASAANVMKAARNFGLEAKGKRYSVKRLKEVPLPVILHWEFNHFLVLEAIDDEYAYLNDPAMGHRKVPIEEFRSSYTGISIALRPGANFVQGGKPYDIVKIVRQRLLKDKRAFVFLSVASFALVIPQLAIPAVKSTFMDNILGWKYETWMTPMIWFSVGAVLSMLILHFLRLWGMTRWLEKLTIADSSNFFWHVLRLPFSFYQQRSPNEVASRVNMNQNIANVLTGQAATAGFDMVMAVFYFCVMLCYSIPLTLIATCVSAINVVGFLYVRDKLLEMVMRSMMEQGKAFAASINGLMMIESLKANGTEDEFFGRVMGYITKGADAQHKTAIFNVLLEFLPLLTAGITAALVMTFGGYGVMDGVITLGIYMAFQTILENFNVPLNNLLGLGAVLQDTEMQLKRLDDVLNYPEDDLNFPTQQADTVQQERLQGRLEVRDLVFGYSRMGEPLFEGFNMTLQSGSWVALVGGSGCGKSTMAKLINGTYEEWDGEMLFDGQPRRKFARDTICSSLATVDQDVYLFNATIEQNIALFDKTLLHQDIVRAAKDACIYDDIMKLEGGFDYMVAEAGANFSGGQRQRLEIARALAINPTILILDEATSALDPVTEKKVMDNIRHRGCTCIVIAHRLSTIRDCDEIIVLDHGIVVERGRHTELVAKNGVYAKLISDKPADKAVKA